MTDEDREKLDQRKARLLGALSGLAASESIRLPAIVGNPMAWAVHAGQQQYSPELFGLPLADVDPSYASKVEKIRKYLKVSDVPIAVGPENLAITPQMSALSERFPRLFGGQTFDPLVILSHKGDISGAAHELGHALPTKTFLAQVILGNQLAKALGIGGGVLSSLSDNEILQGVAPFISATPYIPGLLEELRASGHGLKALSRLYGTKAALTGAARLLPAFISHAVHMTPAIVAPYIAKAVKEHIRSQDKTASAVGGMGRLKLTSHGSWQTRTAVRPHTTKPQLGGQPDISPKPKPPAKGKYYKDITTSIQNPQRGERYA